ncbi:MAG: signal peptide peptidase SppA [Hydrogenovibrio sp.]
MLKKASVLLVSISLLSGCATIKLGPSYDDPLKQQVVAKAKAADGKVLMIPIEGLIANEGSKGLLSQSPGLLDKVMMQLREAERDDSIQAVLLKVNSPGGGVTTSDIFYHELKAFKARSGKKVYVQMMDVGASGAYYLALAADHIQVHPTTLTGSVGVITLLPNVSGLNEKIGVEVKTYKTGENKDTGSPFRETTQADDVYLQTLVDEMAQRFYALVQQQRGLSDSKMNEIKQAKVYLGEEAVMAGLVDSVGYLSDASEQACALAGKTQCDLVTYRFEANANANVYSPNMQAGAQAPALNLIQSNLLSPLTELRPGSYYLYLQ